MLLVRIKKYETDLLITLNIPDKTINAQGFAQGNGDSDSYKRILAENVAIFE